MAENQISSRLNKMCIRDRYIYLDDTSSKNVIAKALSGTLSGSKRITFTNSEIDKIYSFMKSTATATYAIHVGTYVSQSNADTNAVSYTHLQ